MPAEEHTKKANTAKKKRQWEHVYETAKSEGDSEGKAIRKASGVVNGHCGRVDRGHVRRCGNRVSPAIWLAVQTRFPPA